jgi:hypothetical protein
LRENHRRIQASRSQWIPHPENRTVLNEQTAVLPNQLELYLLAELSVFGNLGEAWNNESSLREEVAAGNR